MSSTQTFAQDIRLIYEISTLGNGYLDRSGRTGIYRVVEQLAKELMASKECSIQFCAFHSHKFHYGAIEYLKQSDAFDVSQMPYSFWRHSASRSIERVYKNADATAGLEKLYWRAVKRVVRRWTYSDALQHFEPVSKASLEWANVFHAPFRGFPPGLSQHRHITRFTTVYDLIPLLFPQYYGFKSPKEHFLTESIDAITRDEWVISISECSKNDLCNYRPDLDPKRVIVVPLAASDLFYPCREQGTLKQARQRYHIPDGPYLLSVCTLEPRKNLPHLIRCFRDLIQQESISDLQLVLAGSLGWEYDHILSEIAGGDTSLRARIVMTGRVEDEDMAALYSGATAFVFPSLYEGFGLPPLEAMQCGTPVISSNSSSLPEVCGDAALYVAPTDGPALCAAMLKLYKNEGLRKDLAAKSLVQAAKFSWKRCAHDTVAAYRHALQEKKP